MRFFHTAKSQSGFTLVELAIALMIIGLLVGGILRGQELYNIAKLNKTIKQYQSYVAASISFRDVYDGQLPGDMAIADRKIPGCEAGNTNSCINGNGDNRVGGETGLWDGTQYPIITENTQYWKHLVLAKLIS